MSLSINDGKGTPAAHVFTQDSLQNGADPTEHVNRSNTNGPSFWERIRNVVGLAAKPGAKHVVKTRLIRPIAGVDVNGNPIVLDTHEVILTYLIGQKASGVADIKDTVAMVGNLAANATYVSQVSSLAPINIP